MKTILIVDDSRTTRHYHAAIAASGGYEVVTASDGAEGMEKLLTRRCDLVLTDVNMEGLDGYEFIRRIRRMPEHRDLPVVIVSTEGQERDKSRGFEVGANLYVVKPSEPKALLRYIDMMLAGG